MNASSVLGSVASGLDVLERAAFVRRFAGQTSDSFQETGLCACPVEIVDNRKNGG